jgi:NADPH:quinone reductase-like Zn-dependent oxidoreductase
VRALVLTRHGPPEVLRIEDRPEPEPRAGEVLVRVRAAGVNFADLMARVGVYPDAPRPPAVVGYEFAGDVEALGPGAAGPRPGDRVLGACRFGGYAEKVAVPAGNVLPVPEGWSYEEAAALPVNYATAYGILLRYGSLRAGERVLVHAAAGGVGIAATQLAKLTGAEVFGTASAGKHASLREIGVDHPIDYRALDFAAEVRRITGEERPLDVALDPIGGRSWRASAGLLRPGGRLVCYGASAVMGGERRDLGRIVRTWAEMPRFNPLRLSSRSLSVVGFNLLRVWDAHGSLAEYVDALRGWVASGAIRPRVAATFPLERGADAHRHLAARANVGKVVLTVGGGPAITTCPVGPANDCRRRGPRPGGRSGGRSAGRRLRLPAPPPRREGPAGEPGDTPERVRPAHAGLPMRRAAPRR